MIRIIVKFEIMDLFVIIYTEYIMYMYYNIDTVGLPRTEILRPVSPFYRKATVFETKRGIEGLSDKQKNTTSNVLHVGIIDTPPPFMKVLRCELDLSRFKDIS